MAEDFDYGKPLRGLNRSEGRIRELQNQGYDLSYLRPEGISFAEDINRQNIETPAVQEIGFTGVNDSVYDSEITDASQLDNLPNTRGELQSGVTQLANGLAKGAILAGTTLLDGTLGLLFGGAEAIRRGEWAGLWDNDFSKGMQAVNNWAEEALPNYYTDAEKNEPWYDNIFTANFIGDKFIKNMGFTVGAFLGGSLGGAALKATKLPQIIGAITNSAKMPGIVTSGIGATISALNEGRIEALTNSTDWFELQKVQLDDKYTTGLDAIGQAYERNNDGTITLVGDLNPAGLDLQNAHTEAVGRLSEDRLKMGNMDLLMNLPILTASNIVQFGRLYANGFKTARKATNIVGKAGEYATGRKLKYGVARAALNPLSEGAEELAQSAASAISGKGYEQDVNNFYRAKIDPRAEQQTVDWIKAFAEGINETVNDGSSWEGVFIGYFTGVVGMPSFRSIRNSEGKLQSPITMGEGPIGEFREYREKMQRDTEIANYMNERVNSPEFKNYYQGLIRHNKYQNDMNQAVENNDEFEFKNAEHAQLVSDVAMFDNAGKLDELTTLINSAYDTSDENLAAIVENTTSTTVDESGKSIKIGPFVDKNGNPMYATPEGKQEMIDKLTQTRDEMLGTIDNYVNIKNDIDISIGQQVNDEQLEELTWLKSQIDNWKGRAAQLSSEVKPVLRTLSGNMSEIADMYTTLKSEEGKAHAGLSALYNIADKSERSIRDNISLLGMINNLNDEVFSRAIAADLQVVEVLKGIIEDPTSGIDATEAESFKKKLDDIVKLVKATDKFGEKLKEYLNSPSKLQEDIEQTTETVAKEEAKNKSGNLKERLLTAPDLNSFRQALAEEDNDSIKSEILKELEEEGNELARNYREINSYNADMQRAINSLGERPSVIADALELFQNQFDNSTTLEELANPDSVYMDEDVLYDENLSPEVNEKRFQEAQYVLLRAMNRVNNEHRFKDRFSEEYKRPVEKGEPIPNTPEDDTTGDSETTTIPSVDVNNTEPVVTYEPPIGDVSPEEIVKENESINNRVETTETLDSRQQGRRPYYRPAIPELHIWASKDGDFRPFNVIAKERDPRVNFDRIYDYLRDSGAFDYVNEGNLKVGDELGFMIDPEFNDHTIFIVDTRNNQIVGSLDESEYSVSKFEGLTELSDKIRSEYNSRDNKSGKFIATPTTRVSQVMIGRIHYSKEEKSLATIPNVSTENRKPIFGIIKNGALSTNEAIDDSLILKPVNMAGKEGRMYLLIPNAAGKYSPAAVRVKHFNNIEFDPSNVEVQNAPVYKNIQGAVNMFANSSSENEVADAVKSLSTFLYTGDMHIDYFTSNSGAGIRFTRVQRDQNGEEIYEEKNGKRIRKEDTKVVFLTDKWDPNRVGYIYGFNDVSVSPDRRNTDDIMRDITNALLHYNLPIQVNIGMLNKGGYNNMLINSNVLTSNISDARVRSSWFTTDYFDAEGNLHSAVNPTAAPTPTNRSTTPTSNTGNTISGIDVTLGGAWGYTYTVDLASGSIYNTKGKRVYPENAQLILDIAWINSNFGYASNGSLMWNNKALLPSGQVLDRSTQKYITGKEAQEVKDKIAGRERTSAGAKKVVDQIAENQAKVDRTKTDGQYYYILEDDGAYHEYERVHTRLGSNWIESKKQSDALNDIRQKLLKLSENPKQYNNYLQYLNNHWKVNLDGFSGRMDSRSRDTIVNTIRDKMLGTNSQRTLDANTSVDSIIRSFFTSNDTPVRPSNISQEAFTKLVGSLTEIRSNMEARGERFLTNNIVLFQKYDDGSRVAGEVDILSIDADGNFRIYDVETSKYSFHDFRGKYGNLNNYFTNKSASQRMSTKEYHTLQLSAYKNLFESQYHTPITTLAILPFVLKYNGNNVESVTKEKGIMIPYNPAVRVPLAGAVIAGKASSTDSSLPIFNSAFETQDPVNNVLPESELKDSKVGYFVKDNKIYRSYLAPIGSVAGVDIHMAKIPEMTRGYGKGEATVGTNSYLAVFPNGNSISLINDPLTMTEEQAKDKVVSILSGNPQRVQTMASERTIMSKPLSVSTPKPSTSAKSITPKVPSKVTKKEPSILEKDTITAADLFPRKPVEKMLGGFISRQTTTTDAGVVVTEEKYENGYIHKIERNGSYIEQAYNLDGKTLDAPKFSILGTGDVFQKFIKSDSMGMYVDNKSFAKFFMEASENFSYEKLTASTALSGVPVESGAAKAVQNEQAITESDDEFEDDLDLGRLRRVDDKSRPVWNQEKEISWIKRVLPQLSENDRVKVTNGLIRVAESGAIAWGQFNNGVITLSDIAAEGTTYHEAFHAVFNLLLDNTERQVLLDEAKEMYGNKDDISLEEDMAEGFREYMMSRDKRGIGKRILDFFENLLAKVTNWNGMRPHLIDYYRSINEGKYSGYEIQIPALSSIRGANLLSFQDNLDGTVTLIKQSSEYDPTVAELTNSLKGDSVMKVISSERIREGNRWINRQVQQKADGELIWEYRGSFNEKHIEDAIRDIEEATSKGITFDFIGRSPNIYYSDSKGFQFFDLSTSDRFYGNTESKLSARDRFIEIIGEKNSNFNYLSPQIRESLSDKGWTAEKFNSVSQQEREQAIKCLSL